MADVTLEQALQLLAQPKGARRSSRRKELLREFDPSPVTAQPVQLFRGRYGPYVTDGATNASLPRGTTPEELTFERALDLLAERAARGPSHRASRRGRGGRTGAQGPPRKTAKPKAAKKTVKKKVAKKRTAKKKVVSAQAGSEGSVAVPLVPNDPATDASPAV